MQTIKKFEELSLNIEELSLVIFVISHTILKLGLITNINKTINFDCYAYCSAKKLFNSIDIPETLISLKPEFEEIADLFATAEKSLRFIKAYREILLKLNDLLSSCNKKLKQTVEDL